MNKTQWRQRACLNRDPDMFFDETKVGIELALSVCRPCPVKQLCLDHALTRPERYGVWGGTTEGERKKLGYRKLRKRCPQCHSHELDSSLGYAQACRKCGVSWRTDPKTLVAA